MKSSMKVGAAFAVLCSALFAAGFKAGQLSVDWGPQEWGGGYITIGSTNKVTVCFGLREDGVVVWRKQ